jgi:hypothetical protein
LVCGQLKSKFFAQYLVALAGGKPSEARKVSFRGWDTRFPRNPLFLVYDQEDAASPDHSLKWSDGYGDAWMMNLFKVNACNYCDDAFAELADAAFMDAWLPEYDSEPRGTSLVLARSELARDVIARGIQSGGLSVGEITIGKLIEAQWPVVVQKRDKIAVRLLLALRRGLVVPTKRVLPECESRRTKDLLKQGLLAHCQARSRVAWAKARGQGVAAFHRRMPAFRLSLKAFELKKARHRLKAGLSKMLRRRRSA